MPDHTPTISNEAVAAIVGGYHGDPFAILGPHPLGKKGFVIRTFLPQAASAAVLLNGQTHPLHSIHEEGFYELVLPKQKERPAYQLELTYLDGRTQLLEDPYRFPTAFTGSRTELYENMGAHLITHEGVPGVRFAVWAPAAERVSVIGTFNQWDGRCHPMRKHHDFGTWEIFIPHLAAGDLYKYEVKTPFRGYMVSKSDPVGFFAEMRPNTASVVWDVDNYAWQDHDWINSRTERQALHQPMNVYEVHLASWRRKNGWEWLTYRELADQLVAYVVEMGYTHLELLPVAEHPFDGSWGYQVTGYFAPTSRFGTPDDFKYFVDACHRANIGVILDWVPAHFPKDQHGLSFFDGTYLYEHADPRQGEHPDWGTLIFNYGRDEIRRFLVDNALFWIDKYHIDGLRVDAVASMLYLDFSREAGQWIPNPYGGRENLEAIRLLREMNDTLHGRFPGVLTIAEESTAWPGVTRPTSEGGLGFDLKWNMGWMNDTLRYMGNDPIYRSYHQSSLTFSLLYAFSEKFVLPLSHDEVVHLKRSIVDKMPGDEWQKFANARMLYAYQYAHPGRKLNFMGNEIGQWAEWQESKALDWYLLERGPYHKGMQAFTRAVNHLYKNEPALHAADDSWEGFTWIDFRDAVHSVLIFMRQLPGTAEHLLVACNFTPQVRGRYRVGVPQPGIYAELLNSDDHTFGGSGIINQPAEAQEMPWQDQPYSIVLNLPPLGVLYLKRTEGGE